MTSGVAERAPWQCTGGGFNLGRGGMPRGRAFAGQLRCKSVCAGLTNLTHVATTNHHHAHRCTSAHLRVMNSPKVRGAASLAASVAPRPSTPASLDSEAGI